MLITNNYDNAGNTNKTIIHIPKHRTNRYSFLFPTRWLLFENFTDLRKFIQTREKNLLLQKKTKMQKI